MTIQQVKKIDPDLTPPGYHSDGSRAPKRTGSSRVNISKRRRRDTPACYLSLLQAPQPPLSIPGEKPSSRSHDRLASAAHRSASSRRGYYRGTYVLISSPPSHHSYFQYRKENKERLADAKSQYKRHTQ